MTRLFDPGPASKLTPRQERAYAFIKAAGWDGITSAALGAAMHGHARCDFCASAGVELGRALRRKGLVCQRRREGGLAWTVAGKLARTPERVSDGFPEGF